MEQVIGIVDREWNEREQWNIDHGYCPDGCCGPEETFITLYVSPKVLGQCELNGYTL